MLLLVSLMNMAWSSYLTIALILQHIHGHMGSTANLREIVLGRCWYYKQFKQQNVKRSPNCSTLWKTFHDGFAFKDPCKLTFDDYQPFFDVVVGEDIMDKSLFWSGTYKAVHSYSDFDLRFTTLEDTLEGALIDEVRG
ncbi:hypothetical protein QZH41_020188 [Actinostola sp. cb2023]|nr:hypothetical protein QZH41_020188 [Actinostola sp. cb2023]